MGVVWGQVGEEGLGNGIGVMRWIDRLLGSGW